MSEVRARAGQAVRLAPRWYCPDCERILRKPPYKDGAYRYHSWRCKTPLVFAEVFIGELRPTEGTE